MTQEVARMVLEAVYEPVFKETSHGFRKGHSCHTALEQIKRKLIGTKWIVEVDIQGYFDNIDHEILIGLLSKKIQDQRFLNLIRKWLKAGYLEDWKYHKTYSGTPQGGIISPILANIYLHELDKWAEEYKAKFDKGKTRKIAKDYAKKRYHTQKARRMARIWKKLAKKYLNSTWEKKRIRTAKMAAEFKAKSRILQDELRKMSSSEMNDPNFRRFNYCRYADDFIIGIVGSKDEAEKVLKDVEEFLRKMELETSPEKTGINHNQDKTRFLGYDINTKSGQQKLTKVRIRGERKVTKRTTHSGMIYLSIPQEKKEKFCQTKGIGSLKDEVNEVKHRSELINLDDVEIVGTYNAEIRGFCQYYALADRAKEELAKLGYWWEVSMIKTLAAKHKCSLKGIYARYSKQGRIAIPYVHKGERKWLKAYKIKELKTDKGAFWTKSAIDPDMILSTVAWNSSRNSILKRLEAEQCEYCGDTGGPFEVHHVKKLKDLTGKQNWEKAMIARKRKTMVLCKTCHTDLHRGTLPSPKTRDLEEKV